MPNHAVVCPPLLEGGKEDFGEQCRRGTALVPIKKIPSLEANADDSRGDSAEKLLYFQCNLRDESLLILREGTAGVKMKRKSQLSSKISSLGRGVASSHIAQAVMSLEQAQHQMEEEAQSRRAGRTC